MRDVFKEETEKSLKWKKAGYTKQMDKYLQDDSVPIQIRIEIPYSKIGLITALTDTITD